MTATALSHRPQAQHGDDVTIAHELAAALRGAQAAAETYAQTLAATAARLEKVLGRPRSIEGKSAITAATTLIALAPPSLPTGPEKVTLSRAIELIEDEVRVAMDLDAKHSFHATGHMSRSPGQSFPRFVLFYVALKLTTFSTTQLATRYGHKDHTTVVYGRDRVRETMNANASFHDLVEGILAHCQERFFLAEARVSALARRTWPEPARPKRHG